MTDNVTTSVGNFATDEIGGFHWQRVKVTFGVDGVATDVSAAAPLPVTLTFPTTQAVSLASQPLPTGASTETTLAAFSAKLPGSLGPKTSALSVSFAPASDAIFPVSATALPLPAGAATETSTAALLAALQKTLPAVTYVPVTLGSSNLAGGACRYIVAEVAGRVKLKQPDGTVRDNYPLQAGVNTVSALVIDTPTTGTAAQGIWAHY